MSDERFGRSLGREIPRGGGRGEAGSIRSSHAIRIRSGIRDEGWGSAIQDSGSGMSDERFGRSLRRETPRAGEVAKPDRIVRFGFDPGFAMRDGDPRFRIPDQG